MNLDGIIHAQKNFAELIDADLESFLQERPFGTEHLNLEFKREFPTTKKGDKYDIRDFCKYIVAYSNEIGGLIFYGVSDDIRDPSIPFPNYFPGLSRTPSVEDLSEWVRSRIHPLVDSPAIRFFSVQKQRIAVVKIPEGARKPYCYYEPSSSSMSYYKKSSGGIQKLSPPEALDFHRTSILREAERILRSHRSQVTENLARVEVEKDRVPAHRLRTVKLLENPEEFGYVSICSFPHEPLKIDVATLHMFIDNHRRRFSEIMRYFPEVEVSQDGVSVGYFPTSIRKDIKSTARISLFDDGLVAYDSQIDVRMDKGKVLNPLWLSYECQRHLQLARAALEPHDVSAIQLNIDFKYLDDFTLRFYGNYSEPLTDSQYSRTHKPIAREIALADIHTFDGPRRNTVMPVVKGVMDEVSRIFGIPKTPPDVWDADGILGYVKGLESQR